MRANYPRPIQLLAFLVFLWAGSAYAAPPTAPTKEASPATQGDAQAKKLFAQGEAHYAAGRYPDAIKHYKQAYALSKRAPILFAIGNAYERMGAYDKAAATLRRYLEAPNAKGRQLISERIGRLEATHAQKQRERRAEEARKKKAAADKAAAAKRAAADKRAAKNAARKNTAARRQKRSNTLSYVLLGVGALAVGGAIGLGLAANSAGDDAEANCRSGLCNGTAHDDIDRQKALALSSDIALGVGVASITVGAILLLRNLLSDDGPERRQASSVDLNAAPLASGVSISLSGRF
jgi:tetratricopeptide (TPR) repeat protein